MKKVFQILCVALSVQQMVVAQVSIKAKIHAELGGRAKTATPVSNMTITIIRSNTDTFRIDTNTEGDAFFSLTPDSYTLIAGAPFITDLPQYTWRINFKLEKDTVLILNERNGLQTLILPSVTVTATRFEEDIRRVPFAVNSVSGKVLIDRGARGFESFSPLIPGLHVFGIGQGNLQLAVRGVVTERQRSNRSNTVRIYFDDIPIDLSGANPNFQLFDIERIEFLKGPQGTLYGAGAETGALHIITNSPKPNLLSVGGGIEFSTTSSGTPNKTLHTTVNLPIKAIRGAIRATVYARQQGGYLDNNTTGIRNTNKNGIIGGRLSAKTWLSSKMEATVSFIAQRVDAKDADWFNPDSGRYIRTTDAMESNYSHNAVFASSIKYHFNLGTISLISGYHNNSFERDLEVGRYPVLLGAQPGQFRRVVLPTFLASNGFSEEIRFVTRKDRRIRIVSGLFFSSTKSSTRQTLDVPGMEASVSNLPKASTFGLPADRLYSGAFLTEDIQLAPYTDITVSLSKRFSISTGIRWYSYQLNASIDYRGALQGRIDTIKSHGVETGFNPRLNVAYLLGSNTVAYIQVAKGNRVGGANEPLPLNSCAADLAAIGLTEFPGTYGPDKVWNFEIGLKGLQFGSRTMFGITVFNLIYDEIQVTRRLPCTYSIVQNAGRVNSKGIEAEISLKPVSFLTLMAFLTYTDAKLVQTPGNFLGDIGRPVPYFPAFTSTISLTYEKQLLSKLHILAFIEHVYTSKRETDFRESLSLPMKEFGVINIRAGLKRNGWEIFIFGKNVENIVGILDRTTSNVSAIRFVRTTPIQPRILGLSIVRDFQKIKFF